MFSSLDRIDGLIRDPDTEQPLYALQSEHRSAAEIQDTHALSLLFALTRVLNGRRADEAGQLLEVRYVCLEPPPEFLLAAVTSAGGRVIVGLSSPTLLTYEGALTPPGPLADSAFRALAHQVVQSRGEPLSESLLEALQHDHVQGPAVDEDESGFWTRVSELAAVMGELLRARFGGQWVDAEGLLQATMPFAFQLGPEGDAMPLINVTGHAERFLRSGAGDGLLRLMGTAEDLLAKARPHQFLPEDPARPLGATSGPVMISFKPPDWNPRDMMCYRPLFKAGPGEAVPLLAYGEDLPRSFSFMTKEDPRSGQPDILHAQALENLKTLSLDMGEIGTGPYRILTVSDHYFAAEKVLDRAFLFKVHRLLNSPVLLAGIPRKGVLFLMSGTVDAELSANLAELCTAEYRNPRTEPLTPRLLYIQDGDSLGFLPPEAPPSVRATKKPRWGLLRWLFGE